MFLTLPIPNLLRFNQNMSTIEVLKLQLWPKHFLVSPAVTLWKMLHGDAVQVHSTYFLNLIWLWVFQKSASSLYGLGMQNSFPSSNVTQCIKQRNQSFGVPVTLGIFMI